MPHQLIKWDILRVFSAESKQPHFKYAICVCPINQWFFYINSDPPLGRKAREYALTIENFQATFLKHTSYVDTTKVLEFNDDRVSVALADSDCYCGSLMPQLRTELIGLVSSHSAIPDNQKQIIIT
jgi:hypothetical protein